MRATHLEKKMMSWLGSLGLVLAGFYWFQRKESKVSQNVVIVGASSGIGKEMALLYAKRGCKLILLARRQKELDLVVKECQVYTKAFGFQADMSKPEAIQQALDYTVQHLGTCDTLVLCAGVLSVLPFDQVKPELVPVIFDINTIGPILTTSYFLPLLKAQQGRIVVISSAAGVIAAPTVLSLM